MGRVLLLFFALYLPGSLFALVRFVESSAPYISGDTFRSLCDFYLDEVNDTVDPQKVQPGSCIFVSGDYLERFFSSKHPSISHPYILVSHNTDDVAPGPYGNYLNDPTLVAWFAQNVSLEHPKLHPIPIGIANKWWPHGKTELLDHCRNQVGTSSREHLVYLNFCVQTNAVVRTKVYEKFVKEAYCFAAQTKPWKDYLSDLGRAKFVLSPRGHGLDCLRTWEALYMGAIPVVQTSSMDSIFDGLPVVIVQSWDEVSESFLQQKYEEMSKKKYSYEKLFTPYWFERIHSFKQLALDHN